jgi:hypothetical protein
VQWGYAYFTFQRGVRLISRPWQALLPQPSVPARLTDSTSTS